MTGSRLIAAVAVLVGAIAGCSAGGPTSGSIRGLSQQDSVKIVSLQPTVASLTSTNPTVFTIAFTYDLQTVSKAVIYAAYIGDSSNDVTITSVSDSVNSGTGSGSLSLSIVAGAVPAPANFAVGVVMVDPATNSTLATATEAVAVQ